MLGLVDQCVGCVYLSVNFKVLEVFEMLSLDKELQSKIAVDHSTASPRVRVVSVRNDC